MKKILVFCILFSLLTFLVIACNNGTTTSTTYSNKVDLGSASFTQESITIQKGQSITLFNDTDTTHVIDNGAWHLDTAVPQTETGAPAANDITLSAANQTETLGPFNLAGTYHYYCTIHPGMNLVVTVK